MTMRMYANRKKWPLTTIEIALSHKKYILKIAWIASFGVGKLALVDKKTLLTSCFFDDFKYLYICLCQQKSK
jgi:hypothetical protein